MKKYSKFFIPTIYISIILVMVMCVLLVIGGIKAFLSEKPDYEFTLDDVFDGDVLPVIKTESNNIVKPYISDGVKIVRYFYDYKNDKDKQESSIIVFKNTYIQNQGVDYISEEDFDVVSVFDGEVVSIEDNEVYGKVIRIKHNDNLESIYCNVKDILISVGYKTSQGELIAKSNKSNIDKNDKFMLHFEIEYKGEKINPEELYSVNLSELE